MQWVSKALFEAGLPAHCEPTNDFLLQLSSTFHACIPTPLAFTSNAFGTLSIIAWLFAQLPQIYKNWRISSTSGLSIFFLVEWCLGDLGNLLGALFTHQATWQVTIGAYYVFVDLCLVGQWVWYERLQHGNIVRRVWPKPGSRRDPYTDDDMGEVEVEGRPLDRSRSTSDETPRGKQAARPQNIFRTPTFGKKGKEGEEKPSSFSATPNGTTIHRIGPSSPMPSPSPRTVLLIACLIAVVQASPLVTHRAAVPSELSEHSQPTALENAGTVLSWASTVLYLGSRLPQLIKNWRRKSTAGLSPHLFLAAFCGNLFYSSALLTNPQAWYDFAPYGGGGWVGAEGSDREKWAAAALPFFLGAAGVLGMDGSVGLQFLLYGDRDAKLGVMEEDRSHSRHWRRVSGWMRGWIPSTGEPRDDEQGALIRHSGQRGEDYGTL